VSARLGFFGTPALAATCLQALLDSARDHGHEVVIVVAQPDKPQGRGQRLQPPPTKVLAEAKGIEVRQPTTLRKDTEDGEAFYQALTAQKLDLAIVAAYGRIIPTRVLDAPRLGMVNVHASLLPRWRGAAPIQRCLQAGDKETGVCLMHMVKGLDEGDVYARQSIPIADDDNSETLTVRVAELGGSMLRAHLPALLRGALPRVPQSEDGVTYAHMLKKDEGRLDFQAPARVVFNQARAMHPWPGAFTSLDGEVLKLFGARVHSESAVAGPAGTVVMASDTLVVACGAGAVSFAEAQLPNKKRLAVRDLVRGRPIAPGTPLGAQTG
jgi:methionyl-tRNA formyltransferase